MSDNPINRREFFRLPLYVEKMQLLVGNEVFDGEIMDVSGNGMGFAMSKSVVFEEAVIQFKLLNATFDIKCRFIRRSDVEYGEYFYAVQFLDFNEKEASKLMSLLLRLDAIRRKK